MTIPISKAKGRLTAQVTASSTSISFSPTDSNRNLTSVVMGDFGSAGYIIINPGGSVGNYEIVKFTSWSVASGVITVGGLTRNLVLQGSDSGQTGLSFAAGTTVIVGDNHHWWNQIANTGIQATTGNAGTVEVATDAEVVAGTGTGGSGAIVVTAASSHSSTAAASKVPVAGTNGVIDQAWIDLPFTAGETIDASSIPQAVYLKESDGKVYKASSTAYGEALFAFIGFVGEAQNLSTNDTAKVRIQGIVDGFTGLTLGGFYYLTDTGGTINTTSGTKSYKIGRAKSTTELYIEKGRKIASGIQTFTSTTTAVITCGFKPARVRISGFMNSTSYPVSTTGMFIAPSINECIYVNSTGAAADGLKAWNTADGGGLAHDGTINTLTTTGFTLNNTKTSTADALKLYWVAEE